jgi:nucleoside-diphosphate-sugar epimerase
VTHPDPVIATADDVAAPTEVVVTGAAGWLGQNLVRALAPTRARVRCLVHERDAGALVEIIGPNVEVVTGDVRDPATLDALFDGVGRATVFHTAAVIHPAGRTRELFDVNVGGTELTLDRARRAGASRFVYVSSNSPFGANPTPDDRFTDDSPYNPYLAYGTSKMEAEQIVRRRNERGDVATVVLRAPWFYGPYQPERQTQWFRAIRRGRFPMVGDGTQRRSMVFTGNLVLGALRAEVAAAAPGNAYWIADPSPYELREIFATVRDALAAEGLAVTKRQVSIPRPVAALAASADAFLQGTGRYVQPLHVLGELKDTIACDVSRAMREIGYTPETTLLDGMRASIRWCLERGDRL